MARRKANRPTGLVMLGAVVCLLLAIRLIDSLAADASAFIPSLAMMVGGVVLVFVGIPKWRRVSMLKRVDAITDAHINTLVRQQTILIRLDPYGKPIVDKWLKELDYFVVNHIRPALTAGEQRRLGRDEGAVVARIWERVANVAKQRPVSVPSKADPASMTPAEFEMHCANALRVHGWTVFQTSMSRDQGVDVVAEKDGLRVVLQCKLYSNPVGNKAVQEISAGRLHQQAHYGAVVTNNTYTSAARELANTNGVWLLHYTDLPQLESIVLHR